MVGVKSSDKCPAQTGFGHLFIVARERSSDARSTDRILDAFDLISQRDPRSHYHTYSAKALADGRDTGGRIMFWPAPFGALAIDVAVVGETSSSIIEQKLTANIAPMRRKKYRAGVNLIVAGADFWRNPWRDRRRWVRPITQIFFVHEQAKREKNCDCNNRVQGTTSVRADAWWTSAHELTEREPRREYWEVNTPELPAPKRPEA